MIQDIYPAHLNNHYEHCQPEAESEVILLRDKRFLLQYDETEQRILFPKWREFSGSGQAVYLFSLDERPFFLLMETEKVPQDYEWYEIAELRRKALRDTGEIYVIFTAWHLAKWYQSSRYCGRCGSKTELDTVERAMVCPKCGIKIYPRINPAVIVGVTNGNKLLLTKYNLGYAHNALVAGFTEIGETMEETVQREVMEEVGLKVKNIRYYKSQPWGIAADILMGFYCDVDGDDTIHRDDNELKYAEWVERENIELQPDSLSLTNEMMMMFKEGKR